MLLKQNITAILLKPWINGGYSSGVQAQTCSKTRRGVSLARIPIWCALKPSNKMNPSGTLDVTHPSNSTLAVKHTSFVKTLFRFAERFNRDQWVWRIWNVNKNVIKPSTFIRVQSRFEVQAYSFRRVIN